MKLSLQNNVTLWISLSSIVVLSHHKVTYQLELITCMENIYDYFSMWFVWSQLEFLTPVKTKTHNKSGDGSTHKSWLATQEAITLKVEIKFKLKTTDDSSFLGRMKLSIQASCQSQPGTKRHWVSWRSKWIAHNESRTKCGRNVALWFINFTSNELTSVV